MDAIRFWESKHVSSERKYIPLQKGENWKTDVFSILRAEVEDPDDPQTEFNNFVLNRFKLADRLIVCGQASSHCVKSTVTDMIYHWNKHEMGKIYVLEDSKCNDIIIQCVGPSKESSI